MTRRQGTRTDSLWRLFGCAAGLHLVIGVGVPAAQTVIVKNAPTGSVIELVLDADTVGSAAASAAGYTTLTVDPARARPEIDALIFVDVCGDRRRVLIVERGRTAAPLEASCTRSEITGLFVVRPTSTLVVNVEGPIPSLLLRQGRYNPARAGHTWRPSPAGLVLFGGGSYTAFTDARAVACGNVGACSGSDSGPGYTAGVAYWVLPFLAAEATYLKPANMTAIGEGRGYYFSNVLDADVLTVTGMAGVPAGPLRVYAKGGLTYHRALFATTETINDSTITIDGVTQTIPGGTQQIEFQTGGWGWMFGGGLEVWMNRTVGIYSEFGWLKLKGSDLDGGEGVMNDRLIQILFGGRLHLGR